MKHDAPSVTSVPHAREDADRRSVRTYIVTMGIRTLCFALAVLVTPYGWHTAAFAVGAIILPYIAVVIANAGRSMTTPPVELPTLELPDASSSTQSPAEPTIIRIHEDRP